MDDSDLSRFGELKQTMSILRATLGKEWQRRLSGRPSLLKEEVGSKPAQPSEDAALVEIEENSRGFHHRAAEAVQFPDTQLVAGLEPTQHP
jgi:hypothetical protein